VIWENVKSLEAQHGWSPWAKRDPEMKTTYEGETGQVGSKYSWTGNEEVGSGYQSITAVNEGSRIEQDLVFTAPWESEAKVWIDLLEDGEGQKVTWGFKTEFGFITSVFMLMNDMDAQLGPDFEEGLGYLKEICESQADAPSGDELPTQEYVVDGQTIIETQFGPRTYLTVRDEVKFEDLPKFFEDNYGKIMENVLGAGYEMDGMPSAIYYVWDEENGKADVAAAIPLKSLGVEMEGFESITIEPGLACQIEFMGSYDSLKTPHMALDKHIKEKGFNFSVGIEEYVTDPATVKDESEIKTLITYPVTLNK
jgi:effector-binding domain-containing protein